MKNWFIVSRLNLLKFGLVTLVAVFILIGIGGKGCVWWNDGADSDSGSSGSTDLSFKAINSICYSHNSPGAPVYDYGGVNDLYAGLCGPEGTVLDEVNHRLFVADSGNHRVVVYNLNSDLSLPDRVADYVLGQPDLKYRDSALTRNGLNYPVGLALDSANQRLFVTDYNNSRVMVFDVTTITNGEDAINVLGQMDFTSKELVPLQKRLGDPTGLAYDSVNNRLFVTDYAMNRVMVFDVTEITDGEDAVNVLGQSGVSGITTSTLNAPTGLVLDSANNRLFVSDSENHRVMVFDVAEITDGEDAINVLGQTDFISGDFDFTINTFDSPVGVTYDSINSRLFVTDAGNHRIMVFDVATITNGEDAINVLGQTDFTSYTTATTQNKLQLGSFYNHVLLCGPAYGSNRLFVADIANSRIMVFDVVSGTITNGQNAIDLIGHIDDAGNPVYTSEGANNPGANTLWYPWDVALDAVHHRLFVAESNNNRVLVYNLNSDLTLPDRIADYVLGQPDFKYTSESLTQNGFNGPRALAYDSTNDRLFVGEYFNRRIMVFDVATITNGENAINVLGQSNFVSNTMPVPPTQNSLMVSTGLAYDSARDYLFVVDCGNRRIMVFDVAEITDGENAINVLGQADFTSKIVATTQNGLYQPTVLAYDSVNSRLFVAEGDVNNRIMVFDVAEITDGEDAINVLGQMDFTISRTGRATSQNELYGLSGLAYDSVKERLYVAEGMNNRIVIFDVAQITNGENAFSVHGQPDFFTGIPATTKDGLRGPRGLAYDITNKLLFVGDSGNHRVMVYTVVF